jgi:LysR family carnitine catabolism transcriptional activator
MRLTTVQLEAFLALAETLQFSLAAERCHVSASAFSQMINRLEEETGVRLFDRSTRHVLLTPEGQGFLISAKRISHEIEAAAGELRARIAGRSGSVSIASTPTPCVSWLPQAMRHFRSLHPEVALKLRDGTSDRCLAMLQEGYVDLCVTATAGEFVEFDSTPLFDEPFHLLCLEGDLLNRNASIPLKALKGRDYIDVVGKGDVWEQRKRDLMAAGVRDTGLQVDNFGTMVGLIAAGFGIGLVPRMALPLCRRDGLVARPIRDRGFVRTFYLVKRRGRSLSIAAAQMAQLLRKLAGTRHE